MKKHRGATILLVTVFVVGLSLLLYPLISNYVNSRTQSRAMDVYIKEVAAIEGSNAYAEILERAAEYNRRLLTHPNRYFMSDAELADYKSILLAGNSDVLGLLEIPTIDVRLPIYHGTNEAVLQVGVGHIEGTSLPVGGPSTHSVLSGHRGLPSSKLLSDLDRVKIDDLFMIQVLGETFTYKVDQILTVEPEDMNSLEIVRGEDYVTLVTCTPYGINTHRLLVRGCRTDNLVAAENPNTPQERPLGFGSRMLTLGLIGSLILAPIFIILLICLLIINGKREKGLNGNEEAVTPYFYNNYGVYDADGYSRQCIKHTGFDTPMFADNRNAARRGEYFGCSGDYLSSGQHDYGQWRHGSFVYEGIQWFQGRPYGYQNHQGQPNFGQHPANLYQRQGDSAGISEYSGD